MATRKRLDYSVKIVLDNIEMLEMNIADLKEDWAFTKVEMDLEDFERMEHQRRRAETDNLQCCKLAKPDRIQGKSVDCDVANQSSYQRIFFHRLGL